MATTDDARYKAWFLRGDSETTTTTVVRCESIPEREKKKKKKREDDERKKHHHHQQQQQRSLARRAAEKQRSMMMTTLLSSSSSREEEARRKRVQTRGNAFDDEKEKNDENKNETKTSSTSSSSSRTLRAYASENAQLREALRKSLSRANRLETELEETTRSLSSREGALKDARISHRALQSESKEQRKRDRDALNSLRKTLEERERISRGERARCGRALRYAMDCLRAHAPLAEDERNEGGSVLGSVVAELARLTEIATSAGDVGFRAHVEGSGGVKRRTEGEDDDEAAFLERQADAMRKAKTKITQLEDERKRLLQTLEDATNPRKEYITNEEEEEEEERDSFFSSKPTARDEYLFDQDASTSASANARNFFRKTRSAADAEESNEDLAFALPGADALARDIDALDSELKKLASAFERER
jgi:hypothetical protein